MKLRPCMFSVVFCCCSAIAQITADVDLISKSVVFIYRAAGNQADTTGPLGTGFFMQVKQKSDPKHSYKFLVTARHILDPVWASCGEGNPPVVYLRLNIKNWDKAKEGDGVVYKRVQIAGNKVYVNYDYGVDAAIVGVPFDINDYDAESIDLFDFGTAKDIDKLKPGVEVVSAGLLPNFPGIRRNYPVFRFGHVAAVPDDRIPIPCGTGPAKPLRLMLLDANLVRGNSGAPVILTPLRFSSQQAKVIGIQSIAFVGTEQAAMPPIQYLGVAGVTPINYVNEILTQIQLDLPDADIRVGPEALSPGAVVPK